MAAGAIGLASWLLLGGVPLATAQTITTVVGTGATNFTGDGILATNANINFPYSVAGDMAGNIFIAEWRGERIRKVAASTGNISTVAGNGIAGYTGDGGPASAAQIDSPNEIIVAPNGDLYFADTGNFVVRKVDAASGIITTFAGNGTKGGNGDNGPATAAQLNAPYGLGLLTNGDLLIAEQNLHRIRLVEAATGNIVRYAGTGTAGFSGDGGPAATAAFNNLRSIVVSPAGDVYVSDTFNNRIRRISGGVVTTVAGNGTLGFAGDGGAATNAQINLPHGLALHPDGSLFISDSFNHRVRRVDNSGNISTLAGTGIAGATGDGGPAALAQLNVPYAIAFDSNTNLLVTDRNNNKIRLITPAPVPPPIPVAYYPFNGNANDVTGNGANGTPSNVSFGPDRFGSPNGAAVLVGNATSFVDITATNLNLTQDFTISAWFNFTANGGTENPRIISSSGYILATETTAGSRRISFANYGLVNAATVFSTNAFPSGTWIQAVGVRSSGRISLYVNAVLEGTATAAFPLDYSRGLPQIGGTFLSTGDNFAGSLDDLKIYNRALSASEVSRLYALESTPPGPPVVSQPPADFRAVPGTNVTFSVGISGPGPFTYQWRLNGFNISGATGATLSLNNVQAGNNGYYTVVVVNAFGTVTSDPGSLTVLTPPAITRQPVGSSKVAGQPVTFTVVATGSAPLAYQWRLNGTNLSGAVANSLTLDAVSVAAAGLYSVAVSNPAGVVVSANALLMVSSPPVISTQPAARVVNAAAPVTFTVAALGDAPFTYQWQFNGTNLVGATGTSFSIAAATPSHAGLYTVVVSNRLGTATSSAARLTVLPISVSVPWVGTGGGPGADVGNAIAVDAAGNSYVAGYFNGTATFGTNTLTSAGNTDIFITKQDSSGQLLWARRAGGPGYDAAKGIAVDALGNCYVTGAYEGVADFGGGSLTNTSPTSYADVFLVKYDAAGTLVWARSAGVAQAADEGTAVAVDSAGNVLVTGRSVLTSFAGVAVVNSGRIFVAKYTSAGAPVWARKAGSYSGGNQDTGTGIAADSAGNVFVTGVFYSPVATFGAGTFTNFGLADMFLAKFDAAGTLVWARQAGGAGEDTASGVAVAADGSAYLVGATGGNATFSGSNVTSLAGASADGFIAKYAGDGSVTWVRQFGGSGISAARAVAVDGAGTVHVTGYFAGGATFGTTPLGGIAGSYDAFLTRLDANGVFAFVQQAGGADLSGDFGLGVGADSAGNSIITGYFSGTSTVGGGSLASRGAEDVLVTRFNQFTGGGLPQVGFARLGGPGGLVRMRWPLAASSYILQSTTNLFAPVWLDETNALTLNGSELETEVTPGSTVRFFRLRRP